MLFAVAGCARIETRTPDSLPIEWEPEPVVNPLTLDISPFAGPPVDLELIDVGDVLEIELAAGLDTEAAAKFRIRVGEDGQAILPEIGPVPLAGLRTVEAGRQIATMAQQREIYRQPSVTVTRESRLENTVRVVGAVRQARVVGGVRQEIVHQIPFRASYLKAAIDTAGGLAENAGTQVTLWRPSAPPGEPQVVVIDLNDPTDRGRGSPYLCDGSVVTVEERPPRPVEVVGLVNEPGPIDYPIVHGLRLDGAIGMAGGESSKVASDVIVTRRAPDGTVLGNIKLSLYDESHKNFPLAPGDIVRVKQTPATWGEDVVRTFVRVTLGSPLNL